MERHLGPLQTDRHRGRVGCDSTASYHGRPHIHLWASGKNARRGDPLPDFGILRIATVAVFCNRLLGKREQPGVERRNDIQSLLPEARCSRQQRDYQFCRLSYFGRTSWLYDDLLSIYSIRINTDVANLHRSRFRNRIWFGALDICFDGSIPRLPIHRPVRCAIWTVYLTGWILQRSSSREMETSLFN